MLTPVAAGARRRFGHLFSGHRELIAILAGGLDAGLGQLLVDDPQRPRVGRLSLGCYEVFGGDPEVPEAGALVAGAARPRELIYGGDPAWRRRLLEILGPALSDRPMRSFDPSPLAVARLEALSRLPDTRFQLARLDVPLAEQLDRELEPHALQVYPSASAFAAAGVGFGAVAQGRLVCTATSYTATPGHVEVAIATRPAFRGQGLALAVAARLLRHCLEQGSRPHWNASNPVSQRLAGRLGFGPGGVCEVLYLGA